MYILYFNIIYCEIKKQKPLKLLASIVCIFCVLIFSFAPRAVLALALNLKNDVNISSNYLRYFREYFFIIKV